MLLQLLAAKKFEDCSRCSLADLDVNLGMLSNFGRKLRNVVGFLIKVNLPNVFLGKFCV
jgi:hypothetical protein